MKGATRGQTSIDDQDVMAFSLILGGLRVTIVVRTK